MTFEGLDGEDCEQPMKKQLSSTVKKKRSSTGADKQRKRSICPHGKRKERCQECGGSEICKHKRIKSSCKECKGGSICEHGRVRSHCKECGGSQICEHKRIRSHCKECGGASICEHKRRRRACKECKGSAICPHNRHKDRCKECGGSQICKHNKRKSSCKECRGSSICEHNRQMNHCRECGGASICQHNRVRSKCKECGGASICQHKRQKDRCKECGGSQICPHKKIRQNCKECGGSQVCEHGRNKHECRECGGSQICSHGRVRKTCKPCGGSRYCQHGNVKYLCKECGGASICKHGRRRYFCKECRGGGICEHERFRSACMECRGCKHGRLELRCQDCKGTSTAQQKGKRKPSTRRKQESTDSQSESDKDWDAGLTVSTRSAQKQSLRPSLLHRSSRSSSVQRSACAPLKDGGKAPPVRGEGLTRSRGSSGKRGLVPCDEATVTDKFPPRRTNSRVSAKSRAQAMVATAEEGKEVFRPNTKKAGKMDGLRLKTEDGDTPERRHAAWALARCGPFSQVKMDELWKRWMIEEAGRKRRSDPKTRLAQLAQDNKKKHHDHFSRLDAKLRELYNDGMDENTKALVFFTLKMCHRYMTQPGQHELPPIPGEVQTEDAEEVFLYEYLSDEYEVIDADNHNLQPEPIRVKEECGEETEKVRAVEMSQIREDEDDEEDEDEEEKEYTPEQHRTKRRTPERENHHAEKRTRRDVTLPSELS